MSSNQSHRYREIANELFAEIRGGSFSVGDRIPTEHAISRQYGVSRNTARHAVQELERLGLISRQRGAGSILVKSDPNPTFISSITSISDLLQYAANTRIAIRRIRSALALPTIEGIQMPKRPQEWTHLEGLRYVLGSEAPFCSTDVFLHPDVADVAPTVGQQSAPIYRLIEERHNLVVNSIVQIIEGIILSGDDADDLEVRQGSAGLKVTRAYSDLSNRTVEMAVNVYPAANLSYRMTILRNLDAIHR